MNMSTGKCQCLRRCKDYITKKDEFKTYRKYSNKLLKLIYEYNKENQYIKLDYYPEIKLT